MLLKNYYAYILNNFVGLIWTFNKNIVFSFFQQIFVWFSYMAAFIFHIYVDTLYRTYLMYFYCVVHPVLFLICQSNMHSLVLHLAQIITPNIIRHIIKIMLSVWLWYFEFSCRIITSKPKYIQCLKRVILLFH